MNKLKPHKSVEQIAKKHRLDVSFVKHQLEMGIPIEHEHTGNRVLATDIALQHLDEIPDYYTRLKKMEASAKKEHKKFKDVTEDKKKGLWDNIHARREAGLPRKKPGEKGYPKTLDVSEGLKQARKNVGASKCWDNKKVDPNKPTKMKGGTEVPNCVPIKEENKMLRYCPKCEKDETRDECKYGPRYWDLYSLPVNLGKKHTPNTPHPGNFPESYDHEYSMARSEISTIISAAKRLKKKIGKGEGNLEAWVQSKITKAADYIDTAADYVDSGEMKEEAKSDKKPANPKEIKRKIDLYNRLVTAAKSGRRFSDVGRVAEESVSIEDANGNHYAEFIDIIKPEPLKASKGIGSRLVGEQNQGPSTPVKYDPQMKVFAPNMGVGRPANVRLKPDLQAKKEPSTQVAHYELEGMQLQEKPGDGYIGNTPIPNPIRLAQDAVDATNRATQKTVDTANKITPGSGSVNVTYFNKGPSDASKKYLNLRNSYQPEGRMVDEQKLFTEFMAEASAAWQRKEGKNPEGGLNKKGIASYRREHPGSHLSLAVTTKPSKLKKGSKSAKRRKSFCARMKGMKKRLTSAKTAHDPNSRINKSLRKWNC